LWRLATETLKIGRGNGEGKKEIEEEQRKQIEIGD
jgi:hypothetical protein